MAGSKAEGHVNGVVAGAPAAELVPALPGEPPLPVGEPPLLLRLPPTPFAPAVPGEPLTPLADPAAALVPALEMGPS